MNERELNLRIAETVCKESRWQGQEFHLGDCVALLDGNIVAVTGNPEDAISSLRAIEPNPRRGMVVEVAQPAIDVIR